MKFDVAVEKLATEAYRGLRKDSKDDVKNRMRVSGSAFSTKTKKKHRLTLIQSSKIEIQSDLHLSTKNIIGDER